MDYLTFPKPTRKTKTQRNRDKSKRTAELRKYVLERDGNKCQNPFCTSIYKRAYNAKGEVDMDKLPFIDTEHLIPKAHKRYKNMTVKEEARYCVVLCRVCHNFATEGMKRHDGSFVPWPKWKVGLMKAMAPREDIEFDEIMEWLKKRSEKNG